MTPTGQAKPASVYRFHGAKGKGTAIRQPSASAAYGAAPALLSGSKVVDAPIVLVNADNEAIPNAAIGI